MNKDSKQKNQHKTQFKPIHLASLLIPIIILLLSYTVIYNTHSLTPNQELIVNYVNAPTLEEQTKLTQISNQPGQTAITQNEIDHLDDVAKLMNILDITLLISTIILILISINLIIQDKTKNKRKAKHTLLQIFFLGSIITIISLIFLLIASQINFTQTFHYFHQLFFPQGNFAFPESSFLISNLNEQFFHSLTTKIAITAIITTIILFIITMFCKTRKN